MTILIKIMYLQTAGCPTACSRHGQCLLEDGVYRCSCADGWAGTDCSIALELTCVDNEDNDEGRKFIFRNLEKYIII